MSNVIDFSAYREHRSAWTPHDERVFEHIRRDRGFAAAYEYVEGQRKASKEADPALARAQAALRSMVFMRRGNTKE